MTNFDHGRLAETAAAEELMRLGYEIIDRNWRRPWCEIDIVAEKDGCVFLVEVKYRQTDSQGHGLDYITSKKLQRMHRAAETWLVVTGWEREVALAVMEVSGATYGVGDLLILE